MAENKLLGIYLNDHLAGATAGLELAKRALSNNSGTEYGRFVERLTRAIDEDRRALAGLMDRLGIPENRGKQAAAWVAEKAGRLKLNGQLTGYSPLSRLVEIEGLALGVEGKASLWRSLRQVAGSDPRIEIAELETLLARAEQQRDELERHRLEAAALALSR